MNDFPLLFQPLRIGYLEVRNRIVMSPVGTRLAADGMVTEAFKEFYAARARGGIGLIMLEPCFIEATDEPRFLSLFDDRFIPGLRDLVTTVHDTGTMIGAQLFHAGWKPGEKNARFMPPIPPAELAPDRIDELIHEFAAAAARAREAGFDIIEIHAAHGYLLSQFLSPLGNQRSDGYGGDLTGRTRFVREIIGSVRKEIGQDILLSCRINGADNIPGGLTPDDARAMAPLLVGEGLDIISVSAGALGSYPLTIPPMDTPEGCYVNYAGSVKEVVNIPVVTAGRINSPHLAEEILASARADLVAMARGLVADPELPVKSLTGKAARIRKCIACNVCLDTDYDNHITCTVNPAAGRERELKASAAPQSRDIMIVGAGLSGLETARVAAGRGHRVHLYEEKGEIGGQWLLAASPPHKQGFKSLIEWLSTELDILGVKPVLNHTVTAEDIDRIKPDAVVVATGATPASPVITGCDRDEVITAWEALLHPPAGDRVLVIGGGATGLETAEFLSAKGLKVTVIEMLKAFGTDMGGTVYFHLRTRLRKLAVELVRNTEVREINDHGIVIVKDGQEELWEGFDSYILALGVQSRNELAAALKDKIAEIHLIGDASAPGNGGSAMRQGTETGLAV